MKYKTAIVLSIALITLSIVQSVGAVQAFNFPEGTKIFVDVNNSSGVEDGTALHPFKSIQAGVNAAASRDIVGVASGIYYENVVLPAGVQLIGTDPSTTIIDGNNIGVVVDMSDGSLLQGFTVQHGRGSFGAGIVTRGMPKITNNIIRNNTQTAGGAGAAIFGNCSSPNIQRNLITDNTSDYQFLSGALSFINCSSPIISSNVIRNNTGRGAINLTISTGQRATVVYNTVFYNSGAGIKIDARDDQTIVRVINNIFNNNTTGIQIDFGNVAYLPTISNNDVYGNTTNYSGMPDKTGENGNLSIDPLFMDDFHLGSSSPLIDAGNPDLFPFPDFDGDYRPLDGNFDEVAIPDIGADERPAIDETNPTVSLIAVNEDNTPYIPGTWTNQTVTVKYTCSDAESGIASCPADQVFSAEGVFPETIGTAIDYAGNSASVSFGPIKIDKTPPALFIGVEPNPVFLNGEAELLKNAYDNLSGIQHLAFTNIDTSSVGFKSVSAYATDYAGNAAQSSAEYQVIYDFDGFLNPVTDCTNNICEGYSISKIKPGSTVPLKFQLKDANGEVVRAASDPLWLAPTQFDYLPYPLPDDYVFQVSGSIYEWRKNHQNYVYEWSTKGLPDPSIWLVGVRLDDGMTYHLFVAFAK